MKTHLTFATITAITAGLAGTLRAQTPAFPNSTWSTVPAANASNSMPTIAATNDAFTLNKIAGKPVRGQNNDELGAVSDFLIEPQSGKVLFAIVPSGSGTSGATFRLVPMAAIDPSGGQDSVVVRVNRAQWDQVGTITDQELQGRVSLNADLVQRNAKQFSLTGQESAAAVSNLARATTLRGQPVRSGNEQVGTVDDVLIDLRGQSAAILMKPAINNGGAQSFVVPFAQLQFSTEGAITTTTPASQFQQALAPTGYSSNGMIQGQATAAAVQQALASNASLGAAGVQVVTENRLVLRGTVRSAQQRTEIERMAAQAAPGVAIDNQIQVRGW